MSVPPPPRPSDPRRFGVRLDVEPDTRALAPMRAAVRAALAELDAASDECVVVVHEIVTAMIEERPPDDTAPIEPSIRRRRDEIGVSIASPVARPGSGEWHVDAVRRRVIDALTGTVRVHGSDEREIVCWFDVPDTAASSDAG